jgi:methyl-galactoside transport system substrate-binding protein
MLESPTMKRIAFSLPLLALAAALSAGLAGCDTAGGKPRIGVALFSVDDSFVSAARRSLEAKAAGKARLSVLDGQNRQDIQSAQIDAMIADKAKAIIVNPVDPSIMDAMVFKAKAGNVPIVFFSRDPSTLAVGSWDKAFFVGVKKEEGEVLQVEILAEYWKASPEADLNGDGVLQFLCLSGGSKKLDAAASEENRQKAFAAAGLKAEMLGEANAKWTRDEARQRMTGLIKEFGLKRIEAVICSNDEMALGAIEALKVAGAFKGSEDIVPVVGADGTRFAMEAIAEGSLLGTVRADAELQGKAAFDIAYALASGENPLGAGWPLSEGKYVLIPYAKVTKENYRSFGQ